MASGFESGEAHERLTAATARINPRINAVLELIELDRAVPGPLSGRRILVKDCMDVAGSVTTNGSATCIDNKPAVADAEVVRRVREAGGLIAGKAHLTEYCFGATGENAHFGNCRNPWDERCITGGSSSGSAAAVAAGLARMAIGTDTGGSVRVPAALCGVVGLRPTLGRVSNRGVLSLSTICDTVGPIAATVGEAARLFAVMAGYDPADPVSHDRGGDPLACIDQGMAGLRIGIPRVPFFEAIDPDIADAIESAARRFEALGAVLVDVELETAEILRDNKAFRFVLADVAEARRSVYREHAARLGPEVRRRIELGQAVLGEEYAACIRALWQLKADLRRVFATRADLLLTPTTPVTAPLWADAADMVATTRLVARHTYDLGAAGVPSLSVPCGLDRRGLPIGLQLTATWNGEAALFRAAQAFESATDHHRRVPPIHASRLLD